MEEEKKGIISIFSDLMLQTVPSYANKIYYSLGFLSMTSFLVLIISGIILVFFGPDWWLTTNAGLFVRSVHLWAEQAFVLFIVLHLLIVFLTSGFLPPRRAIWVIGVLMFFLVLTEAEFGYVLRGDFSSQWRSLQGADLYNGSTLGRYINNLNYTQIYGIHIAVLPLIILGLLFCHYLFIKVRGIAKPYKKDFPYRNVKANHSVLFLRGAVLVVVIVVLAVLFKSPLIIPTTVKSVAQQDPNLLAKTLVSEFTYASDTATYMDQIDPYQFDTRKVYIQNPYTQYVQVTGAKNMLAVFYAEPELLQKKQTEAVKAYFNNHGAVSTSPNLKNPLITIISSLVVMAQSGLYESSLSSMLSQGYNHLYTLRFLSDTGVLEAKAQGLSMTTDQYGMLREEKGNLPPGAWWLAPIGFMDHTILQNDENQDRDGAEVIGGLFLLLIAFPYIPVVNKFPRILRIDRLIWRDKGIKLP